MNDPTPKNFRRFAWCVLGYTILVILWGAFVRATGSGAGCGDHWPLCNGEVVPRAEAVQTVIEFTHRATSGINLVLVVVLFVLGFRQFPRRHPVRFAVGFSLFFILTEAAIGAGLVLLQLVGDNASVARAVAISAHLINTFLLLGALAYVPRAAQGDGFRLRSWDAVSFGMIASLFAFALVGATGAIVALGDTLFPATSLIEGVKQDFQPGAHFLIKLRIWHPVTAVLVTCGLAIFCGMLRRRDFRRAVQERSSLLTVVMVTQLALGAANLVLLAPVWMQLVHLLVADIAWIILVLLGTDVLLHAEASRPAADGLAHKAASAGHTSIPMNMES